MFKLLSSFSKFSLSKSIITANGLHTTSSLNFQFSPVLCAEPLKKKKKIDPAVVKAREDRRRKKLEKQIRRLEKNARQLKPIEELETPLFLIDEKQQRTRKLQPISEQEQERRALLLKQWASYRMQENMKDFETLNRMMVAQEKALNELKLESEELFEQAIQPDIGMIPFVTKGAVRTPPNKDHAFVDGEYINVTKVFDGENK